MSKKLDKLKEVTTQVKSVLNELEIRMFIDNITNDDKKMILEQPKAVVELK